jgi:hypothetical protein
MTKAWVEDCVWSFPGLIAIIRMELLSGGLLADAEGRAHWTLGLSTKEAIRRKLAPRVGREDQTGITGKPRPEAVTGKLWCVAKLDGEDIARMEDVLGLYEKPLSPSEPVGCIDEKPGGAEPREKFAIVLESD